MEIRAAVVVRQALVLRPDIVEDDGTGFATDAESELLPSRHLGLSTMSERAVLVGGRLEIESKPGHGTTVYLRVPLHGQAD